MIGDGDPEAWALVIGFLSIMNWVMGSRSVLGRKLWLRDEISFRMCRYVGLGLFVTAWILLKVVEWEPFVWFAYAGAGLMLIGTAKRSGEVSSTTTTPRIARLDAWGAAIAGTAVFVLLAEMIAPWIDIVWAGGVVFLIALGFAYQNRGIKDSISLVALLVCVSLLFFITDIVWNNIGGILISGGAGISVASFSVSGYRLARKSEGLTR